jgi:hypothetical protein
MTKTASKLFAAAPVMPMAFPGHIGCANTAGNQGWQNLDITGDCIEENV